MNTRFATRIILGLAVAFLADAQPTPVGYSSGCFTSGAVNTLTCSYSPTAGNSVIVAVSYRASTTQPATTSMLASNGASLTLDSRVLDAPGYGDMVSFYHYNSVPAGVTGFTILLAGSVANIEISVVEVSTPVVMDVADSTGVETSGTTGTWVTGTFNTTKASALVLGYSHCVSCGGGFTPVAPYTLTANTYVSRNAFGVAYQIASSTGSYTPTAIWPSGSYGSLFSVGIAYYSAPTHDTTVPTLTAFSISPTTVNAQSGDSTVTFNVTATDDLSGLLSVEVLISGPAWVTVGSLVNMVGLSATIAVPVVFPQYSAAGTWTISGVRITDRAGNRAILGAGVLTSLGFPSTITLQ